MTKMVLYPLSAAAMASPTPVLPLVASTMVPAGFNSPRFSAPSMIFAPTRSFTEPPGFMNSNFAYNGTGKSLPMRPNLTSGVSPIAPRMLSKTRFSCETGNPVILSPCDRLTIEVSRLGTQCDDPDMWVGPQSDDRHCVLQIRCFPTIHPFQFLRSHLMVRLDQRNCFPVCNNSHPANPAPIPLHCQPCRTHPPNSHRWESFKH